MNINVKTRQIPLYVLVNLAISFLAFWFIDTQVQRTILLAIALFFSIYLGKRNIDRLGLFIPVFLCWFIFYLIQK